MMTLARVAAATVSLAIARADTTGTRGMADFPDPADVLLHEAPVFGGTFKLSATLQDSMVLQRAPKEAIVWGFATAGTTVTTTFGTKKITSTAGTDTVWRANLGANPASKTPTTLTFKASSGETATLSDVLFGDVFVCGGQSNMQFSVGGNENKSFYAQESMKYPDIRLFTVGQKTSSKVPLMDLVTIEQNWTTAAKPKSIANGEFDIFSAVCWFFGKNVYDGLKGVVPIGLVSDNWGGTRVEQWYASCA